MNLNKSILKKHVIRKCDWIKFASVSKTYFDSKQIVAEYEDFKKTDFYVDMLDLTIRRYSALIKDIKSDNVSDDYDIRQNIEILKILKKLKKELIANSRHVLHDAKNINRK